jgi:uracil phosphoribosyltransferase
MSEQAPDNQLFLVKNPILDNFISIIRDKTTKPQEFRSAIKSMSFFLAYEAAKGLPQLDVLVESPFEKVPCKKLNENIVIVPIMRAGMGMLDGVLEIFPFAHVGHLGLYRDKKTKQACEYFSKMPSNIGSSHVFLVDPLLATGNTVIAAIDKIKALSPLKIRFLCLLSSKEGIEKIRKHHPDVEIYTLSVEREMNKDAYLLPGVGDAGDRLYGTL